MITVRTAFVISAAILVGAAVLTAGCSGDWWVDDDWYDDYDDLAEWKSIYIYLNVGDQDGHALPGVTVWVDGEAQPDKTEDSYDRLGNAFPPDWRGWKYNWSSGRIRIFTRDGDDRWIEILVSKTGYESQRTRFRLSYWDPKEIYVRQTFVMEPSAFPAAEPVDAPEQPEVISSAQLAQ